MGEILIIFEKQMISTFDQQYTDFLLKEITFYSVFYSFPFQVSSACYQLFSQGRITKITKRLSPLERISNLPPVIVSRWHWSVFNWPHWQPQRAFNTTPQLEMNWSSPKTHSYCSLWDNIRASLAKTHFIFLFSTYHLGIFFFIYHSMHKRDNYHAETVLVVTQPVYGTICWGVWLDLHFPLATNPPLVSYLHPRYSCYLRGLSD